ncbi:hypothetical protein Dred_1477 [Desulforamulus reducens MI-1]|uniref:Uncharacterized protein n=1 Tax=Desulforamulus reducens (strain ATCC BAA-1160 / DSM 100696 / MI-1) TaxID=349161 RepID=A4J4K4_DESRM|nr:hypothetical protein [Desulforamulus reducens]ABO50007.1 hypothetical protein Dred_1477 [Desulforamulus reducens MI-1]
MIFVRTGPRFLFLFTPAPGNLIDILVKELNGAVVSFSEAIETAEESNTIVMVTPHEIATAKVANAHTIVLLPLGSSVTLCKVINLKLGNLLTKTELGAGLLLQRLPQGGSKVVDLIKVEHHGMALELEEAINRGEANDTIVLFTEDPLHKSVPVDKVLKPSLLIPQPIPLVYRELRRQAVLYFTHGLANSQWFEVRLNIYDADDYYEIHARRLELVLEDLEAGLILGEVWTKDHALTLFSVAAYQIRLFTMMEPLELKTLLLGMEYDAKGNRFVDIDLYHRQRKIEWGAIAKRLPFGRNKSGLHYRNQLYHRLSQKTLQRLLELEKSLLTN